jgi:hypothetical protein
VREFGAVSSRRSVDSLVLFPCLHRRQEARTIQDRQQPGGELTMRKALLIWMIAAGAIASAHAQAQFTATARSSGGGDVRDCIATLPGGTSNGPIAASVACEGDGAGAAFAQAAIGHVGVSANAFDFAEGGYATEGRAAFTGNVTFTGQDPNAPAGFAVVALNLEFGGILNSTQFSLVEVTAASSINGSAVANTDDTNRDGVTTCNSTFLGAIACGGVEVRGVIRTAQILVPVGIPVPITLSMRLLASTEGPGDSARGDFSNSLDFPIGTDVFTVADGVTANGADLEIVDNRFIPTVAAVPEPATSSLLAIGLAALCRRGLSARIRAISQTA